MHAFVVLGVVFSIPSQEMTYFMSSEKPQLSQNEHFLSDSVLAVRDNNNNDRLTAFDPGQPG